MKLIKRSKKWKLKVGTETWKWYDKAMQNIKAVMWIQIRIIRDLRTQEAKIAENMPMKC